MLNRVAENISGYNLNNGDILREVTVKIGLERTNTQEGITVEENRKTYICEKCVWLLQQEGTYQVYSKSKYLLSDT